MSNFINTSIPLAHKTLSRKEVVKRLLKAAKLGGYSMDANPKWNFPYPDTTHFIVYKLGRNSGFYDHPGVGDPQHLTLEQFEAHCQELADSREAVAAPEQPPIDLIRFDAAKAAMHGLIMQGLIVSNDMYGHNGSFEVAKLSVKLADLLIYELQKPKQ